MKKTNEVVIATYNSGKTREFEKLLAAVPINLRSLADFENVPEAEETGTTFAENATLKATHYAQRTGLCALADDSGLEVAALNNFPGVFSARFGGANLSDVQRAEKLLFELEKYGAGNRRARFVCVIAFSDQRGVIKHLATGTCDGKIAVSARGANGFGYDSVFIPDGFSQTFGELSSENKQKISHRAQATRKIVRFLQEFFKI